MSHTYARTWVPRLVLASALVAPMLGGASADAIKGCIGLGGPTCGPAGNISYCAETSNGQSVDGNNIDLTLLDNDGTVSLVVPTDAGTVFVDASGRNFTSAQQGHAGAGVVGGPAAGIGDTSPDCPWG